MEKVIVEDLKCFTKTLDRSCILFWDDLQRKVYVCPIQDRRNLKKMW